MQVRGFLQLSVAAALLRGTEVARGSSAQRAPGGFFNVSVDLSEAPCSCIMNAMEVPSGDQTRKSSVLASKVRDRPASL